MAHLKACKCYSINVYVKIRYLLRALKLYVIHISFYILFKIRSFKFFKCNKGLDQGTCHREFHKSRMFPPAWRPSVS